ncbi:unnamed protein product, partial [marine sediment metagenome]
MNILVTGGAGYIGSVVCELLQEIVDRIIVIDDLRDGNRLAVSEEVVFCKGNFGNPKLLSEIFSKYQIDIVLHLAASANVPDSAANPIDYYENNISNTITLLKVMKEFGVKKIVFSSSAAVYGEPQYTPIDEGHLPKPVNPYGYSKLVIENILKDCANAYGLKYIIFRHFCVAGATEFCGESRKKETHLIPRIIDNFLGANNKVIVFDN